MIYFENNIVQSHSKGDKVRHESTAAMLTEMEQSSYIRDRHLLPVADCLKVTLDEIQRCIHLGYGDLNISLREHFDHLLRILAFRASGVKRGKPGQPLPCIPAVVMQKASQGQNWAEKEDNADGTEVRIHVWPGTRGTNNLVHVLVHV
jgi:hypothetical protein